MNFSTISFWIVFALLFVIYQLLPVRRNFRNTCLLIASYSFYASFNLYFLPLIALSTAVDFCAGQFAGPQNKLWQRRLSLFFSLFVNLGLLFSFKYLPDLFSPDKLNSLFDTTVFDTLFKIGFPIGISFYTFQTLSYTFDVYRGKMKATRNFWDFALYVSFFPQLLAGPIEKARRLLPQLQKERSVSLEDYKEGIVLILLGLFKKIYVADSLAFAIDFVFEEKPPNLLIFACILMTFRVYADFSGYSDMARGMARFFGIRLVQNFKPFFLCTSPNAFWRSWHISFMEWIRDYLILPFRNFRKREWMISLRILLALLIVGIWHKASLNWVAFGLMHGLALLLYRRWNLFQRKHNMSLPLWIKKGGGLLFMITLYFFSGLLHQSSDLQETSKILQSISLFKGWNYGMTNYLIYSFQFLGPLFIYEIITLKKRDEFFILKSHWSIRAFVTALALSSIILFERVSEPGFIYLDF